MSAVVLEFEGKKICKRICNSSLASLKELSGRYLGKVFSVIFILGRSEIATPNRSFCKDCGRLCTSIILVLFCHVVSPFIGSSGHVFPRYPLCI